MAEVARQLTEEIDPTSEVMSLQMGPSHPATHGTIKFNLKLDGEKILNCEVEIGYLHRGFEKMCEQRTWNHVVPYTDRLNYASPLINNVAFALTAEKLLELQVPDRCQYIRMNLPQGSAGPILVIRSFCCWLIIEQGLLQILQIPQIPTGSL